LRDFSGAQERRAILEVHKEWWEPQAIRIEHRSSAEVSKELEHA
jgi:hypothetical protein